MDNQSQPVSQPVIIKLSNYVRPDVKETNGMDYILNGQKNQFFKYIIDRYYGSSTNRAIIDTYGKFMYGKGLFSKTQNTDFLKKIISKNDLRAVCTDFKLFGSAIMQLVYINNKIVKIVHVSRPQIAPQKFNKTTGKIDNYYFCQDFTNVQKFKPLQLPAWTPKGGKNGSYIYEIKTHNVGKNYYSDPDYLAGLQYAELEEEICNYFINHIKNGLSTGYILNMNGGMPDEETKSIFEGQFKDSATGSSNAGNIIVNYNEGKDTGIEAIPLAISDAHSQYNEINSQCTQKLLISHKVTSPRMFGISDASGFSNNADEIETAFNELMLNIIQPMQECILDALMEVLSNAGINVDLDFMPLRQPTQPEAVAPQPVQMASHEHTPIECANELIELGSEIDLSEWELIDETPASETDNAEQVIQMAKIFSSFPNVKSSQDTDLFKIRYKYAGNPNPQREFCAKMMAANKVYRKEDIELAANKVVNKGLGLSGADTYSIWLYKGGVNCRHFFLRQIYLRRNNKSIGVNEAKKMILQLNPSDRAAAKWEQNDPLVAQAASASNNFFRAK